LVARLSDNAQPSLVAVAMLFFLSPAKTLDYETPLPQALGLLSQRDL